MLFSYQLEFANIPLILHHFLYLLTFFTDYRISFFTIIISLLAFYSSLLADKFITQIPFLLLRYSNISMLYLSSVLLYCYCFLQLNMMMGLRSMIHLYIRLPLIFTKLVGFGLVPHLLGLICYLCFSPIGAANTI